MFKPFRSYTFILVIFALMTYRAGAQNNWLRSAGGTNLDEAADIARVISSNDYYVTGHFSGVANFEAGNIVSGGSSDVFLAKYNQNGNPIWAVRCGGIGTDRSAAVATDNIGQAYIAGFFSGTATFGTTSLIATDSSDVFVAKFGVNGDLLWARQAGGNGNDGATGIAVDGNGNVIITGQFRGYAEFGTISLTSSNYIDGNAPSADIFTAKLDAMGNWLWVKSGSAGYDERPSDVCVDVSNNIYICGQYSGDIVFDQLHTNTVQNAGYLLKYNSSGAEQWFSNMTASLVYPLAIRCDAQSHVIITGENIGQILFFGTNTEIVTTTYDQSIFVAKYAPGGSIVWAKEDGSDSYVTARAIAIGSSNEIYIAGLFECVFSEYANETGSGLFNSAGYRDVFIARYNADGARSWTRQYGGPRSEFCSGIAAGNISDQPRIAGSFEKYFHVPGSAPGFVFNSTNYSPDTENPQVNPNGNESLCAFNAYGAMMHLKAQGNKDIFIANPVDLDLPHFDYYTRSACDYDIVESCIGDAQVPLNCTDSIIICGSSSLYINWNTGSNGWIGPEYEWEWNTGSSEESIVADETGWYSLSSETKDGCRNQTDSIWVEILEVPIPVISDDELINIESPPNALPIELCAPDQVNFVAGDIGTGDSWWAGPNGFYAESTNITAVESGTYTFYTTGENGCVGQNAVELLLIDPLEEIDPTLQFNPGNLPVNDTLIICGNDFITVEFIDQLQQELFPIYTDAIWQISLDTAFYPPHDGFESYTFQPLVEGWHYISATPFLFTPEPCVIDTIWYPAQEISVYFVLLDDPNPQPYITGGGALCPGDSITLTAGGATSYLWSGPGIINYVDDNIIVINEPGDYTVSSFEAFDNGCTSTGISIVTIPGIPQPQIASDPSNAVMCPGANLTLTAQPADAYAWIGPLGENLGSTQAITVSAPGNYVCEMTIGNCVQESNVIDAQLYATPYIVALPNFDLCQTGMVTLIVQTFSDAIIEWQSPLSGSETYKNVFEPGIYTVHVAFCNILTEVTVEVVLTLPEATITASSEILCPGEGITLTAPEGMTDYTWAPGGQHASSIIVTQPGSYSVQVETESGCEAESETFTIDFYPINPPVVSNQSVCFGEQAILTATGQNIFWAMDQFGQNIISESSTYVTPQVTSPLTYYAFAADENCTSYSNDVIVSIFPSSQVSISATDSTFCVGENLTLTSQFSPGIQYVWTHPDGTNQSGINFSISNIGPEDNGWYYFQGSDNNCSSPIDSILISVENPYNEELIAQNDIGICVNSELIITTDEVSPNYQWSTPLGNFNEPILVVENVDYTAEGSWVLVVPGTYCATNSDTTYVNVVAYPQIDLSDSTIYCDGGYMTAHVPSGYDLYIWNTGDTDNEAIVPIDGWVHVEAINLPGCSDRDSAFVDTIDCIYDFPNIFTPNGDADNEFIDFGWLRIPIDEVLIFNRWGNLIRTLEAEPFVWNGKTEAGELVSDGAYYYVIQSGNPGKHFRNLSGYIHVLGEKNNLRN